jgi:pimeloyl-ACP methyl ester carboxylesterase
MFRYGWKAGEDLMHAYVAQCVREADEDWLNAGARPGLLEEVTRRSFVRLGDDDRWVRRPTVEEIATVTAVRPDADVFPAVDVYDRLACPMTIVLADDGFYSARRDEARAVTDAAPGRRLVRIRSNHNVPMTRPAELAAVILGLVRDRAAASCGDEG